MYGTKTFTINGEPYLVLEMSSNTDENGKCCINAKILKHESEECFNIVINGMNKFDISNCEGLIVKDDTMNKTYEYIVFAAGHKIPNKIVVIDAVNMTYSVTNISGTLYINGFSIVVDVESLIADSDVTLTDVYGHRIRLHFSSPIENFGRIFENIYVRPSDMPSNIPGSRIEFCLNDGTMSGYSIKGFKHSDKGLEHNKNIKEVETMPSEKNETKATVTADVDSNTEPAKKEEPTPSEIISQYTEAYGNMTKDVISGNEVFGLLSPEHRMSIAAHLDQIVEILEGYIGK